ncbi:MULTISPECIES: hypothetical protein [Enterobacteriaceae]|uniref:Prophage protein n=1 Tax=Leclercia adecarboxylata TaxID=83655 RepID=A0A4U9HJM2_9ENTR|nr:MULTISPECIES: hypothetical protein [Enterobacteriaceae]KFC91486.1 hypothetical protein GLAD_03277 [Leclercia adecarboxylata ATCC 23216 = NBRC 102595]PHH02951.1 hypothetical protein CRX53_02745 [Leclercia adecarboxylata]UBH65995.1 hypothetical protein LA332_14860 [Leclercia adecarboxylata]CZV84653.1 Uncharacterised protein [Enterobacter hormaechei]CZX49262.1 Uncharacterised protein [Enterobacter hormaechei]
MKSLGDAVCQVEQAQAVLSLWLETTTRKDGDLSRMIGALMTLLDGVPESMDEAESKLADYAMREYKEANK